MTTVVKTLTRADFPEARRFLARCSEPGCPEPPRERWDADGATAWLEGWFREHVAATGHTVVIEDTTPRTFTEAAGA